MNITNKNIFILTLVILIGLGLLDSFLYFFGINLHLQSIGITIFFIYIAVKCQYDIIKSTKDSRSKLLSKEVVLSSFLLWLFILILLKINLT